MLRRNNTQLVNGGNAYSRFCPPPASGQTVWRRCCAIIPTSRSRWSMTTPWPIWSRTSSAPRRRSGPAPIARVDVSDRGISLTLDGW